MSKEIKDYLHLYLGCECEITQPTVHKFADGFEYTYSGVVKLSAEILWAFQTVLYRLKPILRPLSDMTEEELQECGNMIYDFSDDPELNNHKWQDFEICAVEQFYWLLKKHFDLFGLIESGLAVDKTLNPSLFYL